MKKIFAIILAVLAIAVLFVGCDDEDSHYSSEYSGYISGIYKDHDGEVTKIDILLDGYSSARTYIPSESRNTEDRDKRALHLNGFEIETGDKIALENRYGYENRNRYDYWIIVGVDHAGGLCLCQNHS